MGTICTLVSYARDRSLGIGQLERYVRLLEETDQQLSIWAEKSEISQINRQPVGVPYQLSPSLCHLFGQLVHWVQDTGSAFDPAVGTLMRVYRSSHSYASNFGERQHRAWQSSGMENLEFCEAECSLVLRRPLLMDSGAFGKGAALDYVHQYAQRQGGGPWLIDLGGQIMVSGIPQGMPAWTVQIADPRFRYKTVLSIPLDRGSLATSSGSEQDVQMGQRRVSHILDPRTGKGVSFKGSVVVWHEKALVADILSTALYVMGPETGLIWAEDRALAVCFLERKDTGTFPLRIQPTRDFVKRFPGLSLRAESASAARCPDFQPNRQHAP